ncbi:MAG: hypothetical protein R3248_11135 [Candidatus Promineifilaceae bacterium]|nr:hypothetical protein [Candidatus Promineifilaceae bacterium]
MTFLLTNGPQELTGALLIGGVIGIFIGVVFLTASSASEGIQRVLVGLLLGVLLMGGYQALTLGPEIGRGLRSIDPNFTDPAGQGGTLLFDAFILIIEAGLAGALLMVVSLAPFRALMGALAGLIIGTISGILIWFGLDLLDLVVPNVIFGALSLGLVLYFFELLPFGTG